MGNENGTPELPEGAPDNVVLFPPEETQSDTIVYEAAVHTDKVSSVNEKSTGEENGLVHTDSATAELQVSANKEDKEGRKEEEDKEELEFPHFLLPSIDLSTELNLTWGTSLGSEMKNEAVAQGGTDNPLLAGLQYYMEASPPVVGLTRSYDGDPVSNGSSSEPQAQFSSTQQNVPSLMPLTELMNYELQEDLKECEDKIAVLGMSSHADTWSEDDLEKCISVTLPETDEESEQNKKFETGSPLHKLEDSHGGCHGNDESLTNDSSASEEEVFSFRDYILGKKQSNTIAVRAEDINNDVKESHSEEASQLSEEKQQKMSELEAKIDKVDNIPDQPTVHSTGIETTTETDAATDTFTHGQSIPDKCAVIYTLESTQEFKDTDRIYVSADTSLKETRVIQEANPVNEEQISSAKDTQIIQNTNVFKKIETYGQLISDSLPSTHTDKHADETFLHLEPKIRPYIQTQVESGTQRQISGQIETNTKVGSCPEHQRQDLGLPEQLIHQCKHPICSPIPEPENNQANLSLSGGPPALIQHSPQGFEQHNDQYRTDGSYKSISEIEIIHHNHYSIVEDKHEKNVSSASAVVIDFGQAKTAHGHEPVCPLEQGNRLPSGSEADTHTPVWENSHQKVEEESALEQDSAESTSTTFSQTTPTKPETIECDGEKRRGNAYQSAVLTAQAAERESSVIVMDLQETDEFPCIGGAESEINAAQRQKSTLIIFPEIINSPVQRVDEKEETTAESHSNKMPHNTTESKGKGGGLPVMLSLAGNNDTCSVSTEDNTLITTSYLGVLGTCDWKVDSFRSLEGRKGHREEDWKEKGGGGAQKAADAGRVSLTETETCPSHCITASPAARQDDNDLILPVIADTADTALFPLAVNRISDCKSISPPPPHSHLNSMETAAAHRDNQIQNASGEDLPGSDRSPPPVASSESENLATQSRNQQVVSYSKFGITNSDTSIKIEPQRQKQQTNPTSEDLCQSFEPELNMRDIAESCIKVKRLTSTKDMGSSTLKCMMTDCASLPPLMVFESLHHPVKETSFNFEGFLSICKTAPPAQTDPTTGQRASDLQGMEGWKSDTKNESFAFEEEGNKVKMGKEEEKKEPAEKEFKEQKDSREHINTQGQDENTVKNVYVNMAGLEESGKVTDETADMNTSNPVTFKSQSAAGESASITTKIVGNEEITKLRQENKESLNVSQIRIIETNEYASTGENSIILQNVSLQEDESSSVVYEGYDITMYKGDEQRYTEVSLTTIEKLDAETDKSMECVLAEIGDIENMCSGNSENQENESKPEKYGCDDESQLKTISISLEEASNTNSMCTISTMCLSQPDQKSNNEQPNSTSDMQVLSKADKSSSEPPCPTVSQLSDGVMKSDAVDAGGITVTCLLATETSVPALSDTSFTSAQSTNSNAKDVSVIVLKDPGPMLSHCESINDCDIAVAATVEQCSIKSFCDSETEIVKTIAEEKMYPQKDANDSTHSVGVSAHETASESFPEGLFTSGRSEQAGGSLIESENPDENANGKESETSKDARELAIVIKGKRGGHLNSENEKDLSSAPTKVVAEVNTSGQVQEQEDQSLLLSAHLYGDKNPSAFKSKKTEPKLHATLPSNYLSGHVCSTPLNRVLQSVKNIHISSVKPGSFETTCAEESLDCYSTLTPQQSHNDVINCDSLLMHLEDNFITQCRTLQTEEPVHNVPVDNEERNQDTYDNFEQIKRGEHGAEFAKETEEQKAKSSAENEPDDLEDELNKQTNGKMKERKEQVENTCKEQKDCRKGVNISQEHDETAAKKNTDKTEGQNQKSINLDFCKLSGEKNDIGEKKEFNEKNVEPTPVSDPSLTSKGLNEEALGCKAAPNKMTMDRNLSAAVKTLSEKDHTQDQRDLSKTHLVFSQPHELQCQQEFMSAPEVVLSVDVSKDKSNGLANAEAKNYAYAEASKKQESRTVCCSAKPKNSLNNTSDSPTLQGGKNRGVIVDNICPQNEEQSVQTRDLNSTKSPFPVCGESTSRENSNQIEQVEKQENVMSVNALAATENSAVNLVIEASETKEPAISESQECESKRSVCTKSQVSAYKHGNLWNEIPGTEKSSELPVNHSSGLSVCLIISHHESGRNSEEQCFDFITNGDIRNTEIRPDSLNDVAQMSIPRTSQFEHETESASQLSDGQPSTTTTNSSFPPVLQENIQVELERSVQQAYDVESLGLCSPVEHITSLNSAPQSETAALWLEQPNTHLSEQFPDGIQTMDEQDTQCSEQLLLQLQYISTCFSTKNTTGPMKQDVVSNERKMVEGNKEEMNKQENKSIENSHIEITEGVDSKPLEFVVQESRSKDKENQSKLAVLLEEHSSSLPDGPSVSNIDQPAEEVTDGTQTELKQAAAINQQFSQQTTRSFIQPLIGATKEIVKMSSEQNSDTADSSIEHLRSVLIENVIQKDDNEAKEKASKVSESEDELLGSGSGTALGFQVKDRSDIQGPSVISVPEKSDVNSSSDWLGALKATASMSQVIPEQRNDIPCGSAENRPFGTLISPKAELEFQTPTDEIFPPVTEESIPPATEQPEEPPGCRSPQTEAAERSVSVPSSPSPRPQQAIAPALPAHLLQDTVEFPTPPPTPPEGAPSEPQTLPSVPSPSDFPETPPAAPLPHPIQEHQYCEPSARSSDSDGAFETPESTTPVKSASPSVSTLEPPSTSLEPSLGQTVFTVSSTVDPTASEAKDPLHVQPPSRSQSTVFDEDQPIAASGAYKFDYLTATDPLTESNFVSGPPSREGHAPLTHSLSLQSGDLESTGDKSSGGTPDKPFHPRTESFTIGTESAPGTLCKAKKPRPDSLKKEPLSRQNSNSERSSPKPASSSSTSEEKKRGKPHAESPFRTQEGVGTSPSPSPSPAGTLKRNRLKSRVESPPYLAEEITPTLASISAQLQAEVPDSVPETPVVPDEESPIPPSASYKWNPDNFENIDPFRTGGSKVANSPFLDKKADFTSLSDPLQSTHVAVEEPCALSPTEQPLSLEEQPIVKRQPVRLEFDYSEDSGEAPRNTPPPKKLGKKPGAKMPIRKPKLGIKKAPPPQTEQLDNAPVRKLSNDNDDIPIPKASYNFDPSKWDDPNFNPFSSNSGIPNSPRLSGGTYSFDPKSFDDPVDPFKPSKKMGNSPPNAASFDLSTNDNDNDNIVDLEDHNQNKTAKIKKKPLKSNTFRVKKSPKRSPITEQSAQCCPVCSPLLPSTSHTHHHLQEHTPNANPDPSQDHATDEEKLASSTNQKWATRHDVEVELISDVQDFPQPSDFTAFVNENSLPSQNDVTEYEIEYMEKIGSSAPPLSMKKPSLYLKLDSVNDSPKTTSNMYDSEPNSPCTGSFEEMEAQISQGKSSVLPSRGTCEPLASEKSRKRESRVQSNERDGVSLIQGPMDPSDLPLLDRLSDSTALLSYLEPDLAETNPTAFAQKLQEELVLAALRIEALQVAKNISQSPSLSTVSPQQQKEMASPGDSGVLKSSLYSQTGYSVGESPHLPRDMDHSLGIAREEIVVKEKEALEWKRQYEDSRREVEEMRRIVMEFEKTIAEMIEGEQRQKTLSDHTIQQLILEKDQALADLNSVEKSLADLFRRYEKMKDVLEGFRKNEEVLKKCAQEYLSRVRKEEQRYQALKIHAEEKLDKANADIAQVRAKAKQEQAAYQASLRKEQMKVDSLECTLEQKNKEIEELTKICDELIAKMGKS
ncbi:uncharacterized protein LOC127618309 [Xyrauchen texanus]|uniref:uncharacterized protein LOC127618309 n=1 Tax=Xyrauchen texanus TaxID=154827 RepID=UPI0022427446|nr:uncharacterized protein LOC127618309 [Xyrauchen texanus]